MSKYKENEWLFTISAKRKLIDFNFKEIWRYRDLLLLFVKRDIVTVYKQTILGPLWYLIQPLLTSVIFTVIFNGIANINVGGIHPFLFNLAGVTMWNYFAECFKGTSDTFKKNENIFNKVYFPRVIMPMSVTISNLLKFGIQFSIFIGFYIYFSFDNASGVLHLKSLLWFPVLLFVMACLGLGFGMIISSMTTKYRDLTFLVGFGVQLLMYLSAVMYPIEDAIIKLNNNFPKAASVITPLLENNPLAKVIESFRFIFFSEGRFSVEELFLTVIMGVIVFLLGLAIFNKTEKSFIDTI